MIDIIGIIFGLFAIGSLLFIMDRDMKRQREERERFKSDLINSLHKIADVLSNR